MIPGRSPREEALWKREGLAGEALRLACLVALLRAGPDLAAQVAAVDLGSTDAETGLASSFHGTGTDGENAPCAETGAGGTDPREGRKALAGGDDFFLYFTVTAVAVSSGPELTVSATVFDAPGAAQHRVLLEYATERARDAGDLREVFSLHPSLPVLEGSGSWVDLRWVVRDAEFAAHLQHAAADFRLSSRDAGGALSRLCFDKVEVAAGSPPPLSCPADLNCAVDESRQTVTLSWESPEVYDRVIVFRNGLEVAVLAGEVEGFADPRPPGRYRYRIVPLKGGDACHSPALEKEARLFPSVVRCGCPNPDLNGDGRVDVQDLAIVTSNLDFLPGNPRYSPEADATRDGAITLSDVRLVLKWIRFPGPFPTRELEEEPLGAVDDVAEPGPMLRIESPYARGSGRLEEIPESRLRHGRLLVASGSGASERLIELDPATGAQAVFASTQTDARGDPGVAGLTALSFEGPAVAVANRRAASAAPFPAGSLARLDPRDGKPLEGPPLEGVATGVFVGDEDAIDQAIGPETGQRPAGGHLREPGGVSEGGAGPDGPTPSPQNRVFFATGWEHDALRRRAFITAGDLDTGLYEVAAVTDPALGLPGPIVFVPGRDGLPPEAMPAAVTLGFPGGVAVTVCRRSIRERPGEVALPIDPLAIPARGDYIVRLTAKLPPEVDFTRVEVGAEGSGSSLGRRLYRGVLPGKLGGELAAVPLGRLPLGGEGAGETLFLRVLENCITIQGVDLVGPVGGDRLFVATRDPGSIQVYGLVLGEAPGGQTIFRGILERIFGVCEVEVSGHTEALIDPVAMQLIELDGEEKLLVLDSLRRQVSYFSLEGEHERCVHVPLVDRFLTGVARAPGGAGELPALFLGAQPSAGGGAGGGAAAGEAAAGQEGGAGGGPPPSGSILSVLDLDAIFFDRAASDIIRPLGIGERRDLVLRGVFSDGSIRDVTSEASYTNLHPEVVELEPVVTVRARRAAGFADIVAQLQGLATETRVHVSAAGKPFRERRPIPFNAEPLILPGDSLAIFPNPQALEESLGTSSGLLRFPVGYRQWFTAVKFDGLGRASGLPAVSWEVSSSAGNTISPEGILAANQSENPSAVGLGAAGEGLSLRAALEGFGGGFQTASLESAPLPVAVFDPVAIPGAPLRAIRIFPRDLQVLPGSTIRFVAALVDEDGVLRNIEPPAGDLDPNLPGARWSSDGLPIDPRTGLFRALYSGETEDETSTITVVDPGTGLSDSVAATVLYSQANGLETLAEAQTLRLRGSLLKAELRKILLASEAGFLDLFKLSKERAPTLAEQDLEDDLSGITEILDFLIYRVEHFFSVKFLGEMEFNMDPRPGFELADVNPGGGKDALEVRLQLKMAGIPNFALGLLKFNLDLNIFSFVIEDLCKFIGGRCGNRDLCSDIEKRPANQVSLGELLADSKIDYVARMDLATGRFGSTYVSAVWTNQRGKKVEEALSQEFLETIGFVELMDVLKVAIKEVLFSRHCFDIDDQIIRPAAEGICAVLVAILGGLSLDLFEVNECVETIVKWVRKKISELVDDFVDGLRDKFVELLAEALFEKVVVGVEDYFYDNMRDTILEEVERGFEALTSIDDLGRLASLRFGGDPVADPTASLTSPPIGAFQGSALFAGEDLPGFVQGMQFQYSDFPAHAVLAARGRAGLPSANPLDPENGPPAGNLGAASRAEDVISNLLRYGASTAYRRGPATLRRAIPLGAAGVSTPEGPISLEAASSGSPRLVFEEGAPGAMGGRVELLVLVRATGALEYTVAATVTAPLIVERSGSRITVDVVPGPPGQILAPAAGEVPHAGEILALVAASLPDPRGFMTGTLAARLPVAIEYPAEVGEREDLGRFRVALEGGDTDEALEDDLLTAVYDPEGGGGAVEDSSGAFLRGDCNQDGKVDISDPVFLLRLLRGEVGAPECQAACDSDGGGSTELADAAHLLLWLTGGPPPPPPFPSCGSGGAAGRCPRGSDGCR